jgi:hypothetical protein
MVWTNRIANKLFPPLPAPMPDLPSTFPSSPRSGLDRIPEQLPLWSSVAKGDRVRICKGIFRGIEGTVVDRCGPGRLIVAVELLEQGVTIELDTTMVRSLKADRRLGFRR